MTRHASPIGTVLAGTYRITRAIAEGGMGTVYEAVQIRLNRRFAVKLLSPEATASPEGVARFRREAEVMSQLAHPHLIHVADFGTTDRNEPYLVMEFLDGRDLEQRLRREGRLSLPTAVHIAKQVASALSASHAQGIVHRDLKPANIFLLDIEGEPDFVKVVDFGISKMKRAPVKLTRPSVLMGTPSYMPPEQATGKADSADHRADQWALAAVTWEMLSGRPPFVRDDVTALLHAIAHEDPPSLAERAPGVPRDVEATLRRALAKRPGDRFATVAAFARALETAATAVPVAVGGTALGLGAPSAMARARRLVSTAFGAARGSVASAAASSAPASAPRAATSARPAAAPPSPAPVRRSWPTLARSLSPQALVTALVSRAPHNRGRRYLVAAALVAPLAAAAWFFFAPGSKPSASPNPSPVPTSAQQSLPSEPADLSSAEKGRPSSPRPAATLHGAATPRDSSSDGARAGRASRRSRSKTEAPSSAPGR